MPVGNNLNQTIYQREIHNKSRISRAFRNFLCRLALGAIEDAKKILDIGCGEGLLLEQIIAHQRDSLVCGIDLNLENARICLSHRLPVILADAGKLPFADGVFDVCMMTEVIEHLEEGKPQDAIREITRILKRGGKLFLMFPNDKNYKVARMLTLKLKEAFYNPGHIKQWTPRDAVSLLQENLFFVSKSFSVPINIWPLSLHHILIGIRK